MSALSKMFHLPKLQPQFSGLLFIGVHHLANAVRPQRFHDTRNSDANRWATNGLTASSLLYWNYVLHSKHKTTLYNIICALDYVMIGTNSLVSTFPHVIKSKRDVIGVCCVFAMDTMRHYKVYRNIRTYKMHQIFCVLSTFVGLVRSTHTRQWSPILLRMYSTMVCSCIFYLSLARMHSFKHFRRMPWYFPWLWHLHATICQQTSIEIAHDYHQKNIFLILSKQSKQSKQ